MAKLTETKFPYEFLTRWDPKTGILLGSHVGFVTTIFRDDVVVSHIVEPVMPVGTDGFPLKDILQQLQIDALKAVDIANTEKAEALVEKEKLKAEKDAIIDELILEKAKKHA